MITLKYYAQAPGKIIITGEHFVVHGSYALSAAIDRFSSATSSLRDESIIISKDLQSSCSLNEKNNLLSPLIETLKETLGYLDEKRGVKVEIDSNIPLSAGLGSSASTAVALVASVAEIFGHHLNNEEIFKLALVSEKIIHKTPSGIDVKTAIEGGILLYNKENILKKVNITYPVDFMIGCSGTKHKTSSQISTFLEMSKSYPAIFKSLINSISYFSKNAANALENNDLVTLSYILNSNQSILRNYGVSSPLLDNLVEIALKNGSLSAKLTGGGGGGSIIILAKPENQIEIQNKIKKHFSELWMSKIPQKGLIIRRIEY